MQHACWVAGNCHTGSDITSHHAAGADDRVITDADPREQNRAPADPDVSANRDRLTALQPSQPLLVVAWMVSSVDLHTRANLCFIPYANGHHVQQNAVEVEKDLAAQVDVVPVITEER